MIGDEERQKLLLAERWLKKIRDAAGDDAASVVHAIEARLEVEPDQTVRRQLDLELAGEYKIGRASCRERV